MLAPPPSLDAVKIRSSIVRWSDRGPGDDHVTVRRTLGAQVYGDHARPSVHDAVDTAALTRGDRVGTNADGTPDVEHVEKRSARPTGRR